MNQQSSKNAIILIGNGFDLAHGLETSYNSFAENYCKEVIFKRLITSDNFEDSFFNGTFQGRYTKVRFHGRNNYPTNFQKFLDNLVYIGFNRNVENSKYNLLKLLLGDMSLIKEIISNTFLGKLYANNYDNWFDIEQAYYNELKEIYKSLTNKKGDFIKDYREKGTLAIEKLNNELIEIKKNLKDYLEKHASEAKDYRCMCKFFNYNFENKENIYVVNFNYTKTFEKYREDSIVLQKVYQNNGLTVNYIHGTLFNNNMIFGYGDDTDEHYAKMKSIKIDEFLENFKTFKYVEETRFDEITSVIASFKKDYEVFSLGHSFGMTDKTILKKIIGNEKCKNIHLFKRPELDEDDKIKELKKLHYSIARILSDDEDVRNKIVPITVTSHFPYGNPKIENSLVKEDIKKQNDFLKNEKKLLIDKKDYFKDDNSAKIELR